MRLLLGTSLFLLSALHLTSALKCPAVESERLDCAPDKPNDSKACSERKCCFNAVTNNTRVPKCFFPSDFVGYQVKDVKRDNNKLVANLERRLASGFPRDVQRAQVVVTLLSDSSLRIKVTDTDHKRYEPTLPQLTIDENAIVKDALYDVVITKEGNN